MKNGEPNIYAALATLRNGYVQGQWARLQLFLAFNAIAIPIVLTTSQSSDAKSLLSLVGILIHYAVLLGAIRANDWMDYLDGKLAELEELDADSEIDRVRILIFSDPDFGHKRQSKWSTRFSFIPLAILAISFWIIAFIYNGYLFLK